MALNSRRKGKVGELEAVSLLKKLFGWTGVRRSQQHCATDSAMDIIVQETPGLWYEIKRVQKLNVPATMKQSKQSSGGKPVVLLHRPNQCQWMITCFLEELPAVIDEISRAGSLAPKKLSDADEGACADRARGQDAGAAGVLPANHSRSCRHRIVRHPI